MSKKNRIIYWVATGLLTFGMTAQGITQMLQSKGYADIITNLGYPLYLLYIIGAWKILGVIAILIPRTGLLKEWAYAGFVFVMSGAAASHILSGAPAADVAPAVVLLFLIFASWYFRPEDRKVTPLIHTPAL